MYKKMIKVLCAIGFVLLLIGIAGFDSNFVTSIISIALAFGLMTPAIIYEDCLGDEDEM